jgi:hypothetical protein
MKKAAVPPKLIRFKKQEASRANSLVFYEKSTRMAHCSRVRGGRLCTVALTLAIASLLILPSFAKADTFEYDYTSGSISSGGITGTVNIVFTVTAATPPTAGVLTSFTTTTSSLGTVTAFAWYSAGGSCYVVLGPCAGFTTGLVSAGDGFAAGSFLSPGTYTAMDGSGASLVITDLGAGTGEAPEPYSAAREPSSLLLLACGLCGLLAMTRFGSRTRRFGS